MKTQKQSKRKQHTPAVVASDFIKGKKTGGRWVHRDPKQRWGKVGNPRVAFRAPGDVVRAFVKKHKNPNAAWQVLRVYMSKATGVPLTDDAED